jgi:Uma2 family endonuclease
MSANPIPSPMTADEFLRFYGEDDTSPGGYELLDGEVYPRPMPGCPHDVVKNNLKELFDRSGVDRNVFRCWIEHTFRLSDSRVVTPDVAVVRTERVLHHAGPTDGSPEIPIEVAGSDNAGVLHRKISAYLRNGAHAVCCAYPDLKTITVYTAREWRELTEQDQLEFPALLPGVRNPVAAVFEGI